jgi:excisionase family DNA binding protein
MIENLQKEEDKLLWRFPETGIVLINPGSQLAVRDNQVAVLLQDDRALASFCSGQHTLAAADMPQVEQWTDGIEAEVYFVNISESVPVKWGIQILPETHSLTFAAFEKVLSHGILKVHIADPWRFVVHHVETLGAREPNHVWGLMREMIAQVMIPVLNELTWPATDHPLFYQQVADYMQPRLQAPLAEMGAVCRSFTILGLSREGGLPAVPIDPGHPMPIKSPALSEEEGGLVLDRGAWLPPSMMAMMSAATEPGAQPADAPAEIMDLAQAAAYLQRTEAELLELIEAGQIKARLIGSGYRLLRPKLDEWLAQHKGNP